MSGWKNEQVTFPIEGLELPRGSTIVEVMEMNSPDDPGNGIVVWFDCKQPLKDVYIHVDSTLTDLGFTVIPESMPFSENLFQRGYISTNPSYGVMFVHYGDYKKSNASLSKYSLMVGENPLQEAQ